MQKLRFVNGKGVEIDLTSGRYGITEWSGFSNSDLNIQSQQVPFQDGAVFLDALYNPRELSVTVAINDENDLEKRYELKRELISAMNAKLGEGYLYYKNDYLERRIKVVPQLPIFENKNSNDPGTLKASLSWTAPEVYWEDVEETKVSIPILTDVNIENEGDIPCAIELEMDTWNCPDFSIKNKTNNKKIALQNIQDFERVLINTGVGKKSIMGEIFDFNIITFGEGYNAIIEAENKLIVICPDGVIFYTTNGNDWKSCFTNIYESLNAICYSEDKNLFVVVGDVGTVLTSPDGTTWTSRVSDISANLTVVTYSENKQLFVAAGENGTILTSPNGITWTSRTSLSYDIKSLCCSDSLFVAVGADGNISTSSNGISWTSRTSGVSSDLLDIVYADDKALFVAIGVDGVILTSSDGTTWTSRVSGTSEQLNAISYAKDLKTFYVIGVVSDWGQNVLSSLDGVLWEQIVPSPERDVGTGDDIIYSNILGVYFILTGSAIVKTLNFYTHEYQLMIDIPNAEMYSICYSKEHNLFVAVGAEGKSLSSSDGKKWDYSYLDFNAYDIMYSEEKHLFIAVQDNGCISTSSSGVGNWDLREIDIDSGDLQSICYSKEHNLFVIVNNTFTRFLISSDLETWTSIDTDLPVSRGHLNDVVYSEGKHSFFAVGQDIIETQPYGEEEPRPIVFISLDGINWNKHTIVDDKHIKLNSIACSNNMIVASGYYEDEYTHDRTGKIFVSQDGITWDEKNITIPDDHLVTVKYENNLFFVLGSKGTILISVDGITWYSKRSGVSTILGSVAYSDELKQFVVVGDWSLTLLSEFTSNNIINKLSADSDMTFNLEQGNNVLNIYNLPQNIGASLTYRQKYLGV